MAISNPLINGRRYSFYSILVTINGQRLLGFKSINYDDSIKKGVIYGTTSLALGRTRGKYEAKCDFEMYRLEADTLMAALQASNGGGQYFGEVPFTITVQYSEAATDPTTTDVINGVLIETVAISNSEGTDGSTVKFGCSVIQPILWNGRQSTAPIPTV